MLVKTRILENINDVPTNLLSDLEEHIDYFIQYNAKTNLKYSVQTPQIVDSIENIFEEISESVVQSKKEMHPTSKKDRNWK